MQYFQEKTLEKIDVSSMIKLLGLLSISSFLPFFIHLQWVTGPIVNAILILILFLSGIRSALFACLIPSLMALSSGLLPAILAPAVPFIMIGNVIFVLSIDFVYQNFKEERRGYIFGVLVGAVLKFLFLFFSVSSITNLLIKKDLAVKVAQMTSWTQLATALTGGMIAWIILKWLRRV